MAVQVFIQPCLDLQKISVLLFYRRIFVGQTFCKIVWCSIGFCVAWTIAFEFVVICMPFTDWIQIDRVSGNADALSLMCSALYLAVKFRCVNQVVLVRTGVVTDVIIDGVLSIS